MTLIEKLEALIKFHSWDYEHANGDIEKLVSVDDLRAIIEEYKNAQEPVEYWLYEIDAGQGVFQGCTGDDAERVVHQVANEFEGSGKPFKVFTHPPLSDETVKDAED